MTERLEKAEIPDQPLQLIPGELSLCHGFET